MKTGLLVLWRVLLLAALSGNGWIGWQILQRMPPNKADFAHTTILQRRELLSRRPFVTVDGDVTISGDVEVGGTVSVDEIQKPVKLDEPVEVTGEVDAVIEK